MDSEFERQAALKGFRGHSALLDPDGHVNFLQGATTQKVTGGPADRTEFDTPEYQDALNARMKAGMNQHLLDKGYTQEQIDAAERGE